MVFATSFISHFTTIWKHSWVAFRALAGFATWPTCHSVRQPSFFICHYFYWTLSKSQRWFLGQYYIHPSSFMREYCNKQFLHNPANKQTNCTKNITSTTPFGRGIQTNMITCIQIGNFHLVEKCDLTDRGLTTNELCEGGHVLSLVGSL